MAQDGHCPGLPELTGAALDAVRHRGSHLQTSASAGCSSRPQYETYDVLDDNPLITDRGAW